nr:Crp/Fnr family transcriptional regulator [Pararoseomonas baculiformis]
MELPVHLREFEAGHDIVRAGDRPQASCLILSGFVCRYMLLSDGRRQIVAFHPPGDIPDLQTLHLKTMDHNVGTMAPTTAAFIPHEHLHRLTQQHPGLLHAFWRETLIDAAVFRAWLVSLGRKTAHERIAHLLCEMAMRFASVGLAEDHSYQMPVTQGDIADALGLSNVHVNRVLQDLRRDELIHWRRNTITVLNWKALEDLAGFDPGYLHIRPPALKQ